MDRRLELQALLESVLGSKNVYFHPPESVKLVYPCIVYKLSRYGINYASNKPYIIGKHYAVTIIDRSPVSEIPDKVSRLMCCAFDRHYTADNLNHWAFNIYF